MFRQEPAVIVTTVTSFLTAIIGLGAAFGLDISEIQKNAVIATVLPVTGLIFLLGFAIRGAVYSPSTTDKLTDAAFVDGASGQERPPVVR